MDAHLSLTSTVILTPLRAGLQVGQDNVVDVLVRVQAPDAPSGPTPPRPPQALALVLDRSGSMDGRPLAEARRCAEFVLQALRPVDSVALVQFDNRVQRLWPAVPLGDGQSQRMSLAGIAAGGNTDLHGGWRNGAEALADVAGTGLKRVILLSDGQANAGLTDAGEIAAQCAVWAGRGVTTSTYGLGKSFNEDLMVAMARAGGGNHYYGDTADDLMEPFQQELALLDNLALRHLRLAATPHDGITLEMRNQLPALDGGWRLPDLAWGAEAWAVVRLRVPAAALPAAGDSLPLLRVAVDGLSLEGDDVQLERAGLSLPVMSAAQWQALPDDELVARRLVELAAADAMSAMGVAASRGDWAHVDQLLADARARFGDNAWVAAMLEGMAGIASSRERARAMKESAYSSAKLRSRLAAKEEALRFNAADEAAMPAFLKRKPLQGKGDA
jgi:Ca-activated chloride channel family protein